MYWMCKEFKFLTDLVLLSALVSCRLAGHSGVKYTVTLSNDAVVVICRFMYSSDADRGEQDHPRAATDNKMRLEMKLAV